MANKKPRSSRTPARHQQTQQIQSASFQGPLPPPNMLAGYEEILPGSAERLLALTEEQARHRRSLESKTVDSNVTNERLGMIAGFILCLIVIAGGFALIWTGRDLEGLAAVLSPLAILTGVFAYGKHRQQKELSEKRRAFQE